MTGKTSSNDCPACCIECAAIARLCSDAIARHSPFAKQLCALCADICDWCAKECDAHEMGHCKSCAEACRRCAEACRKILLGTHRGKGFMSPAGAFGAREMIAAIAASGQLAWDTRTV